MSIDSQIELRRALQGAIVEYIKAHPKRSQSSHRQKDIHALRKILDTTPYGNEDDFVEILLSHFTEGYYTGLLDRSDLENRIVRCIFEHSQKLREAYEAFDPVTTDDAHADAPASPAQETSLLLSYSLKDYIEFGINKYIADRSGVISPHRQSGILHIQSLLDSAQTDAEKVAAIKAYFARTDPTAPKFESGLTSSFKNYVQQSLEYFQTYQDEPLRQIHTLTFSVAAPKGIILFLPGWRDNRRIAEHMGRVAQKEGFITLSYDFRGHGQDAERHHPKKNSVPADLFGLDFQKMLTHVKKAYPGLPISLVGYSLGGAVLATENYHIQNSPEVKNVSLLSPAVSSNIVDLANIFERGLYRKPHSEVRKWYSHHHRQPGGTGAKTFTIANLLLFMYRAWCKLKEFFTGKTQPNVPWRLYSGKRDYFLVHKDAQKLPESANRHITFFSRAHHPLPIGRHKEVYLPRIMRAIKQDCLAPTSTPPQHTCHQQLRHVQLNRSYPTHCTL